MSQDTSNQNVHDMSGNQTHPAGLLQPAPVGVLVGQVTLLMMIMACLPVAVQLALLPAVNLTPGR